MWQVVAYVGMWVAGFENLSLMIRLREGFIKNKTKYFRLYE